MSRDLFSHRDLAAIASASLLEETSGLLASLVWAYRVRRSLYCYSLSSCSICYIMSAFGGEEFARASGLISSIRDFDLASLTSRRCGYNSIRYRAGGLLLLARLSPPRNRGTRSIASSSLLRSLWRIRANEIFEWAFLSILLCATFFSSWSQTMTLLRSFNDPDKQVHYSSSLSYRTVTSRGVSSDVTNVWSKSALKPVHITSGIASGWLHSQNHRKADDLCTRVREK
jgi:hypothetical protein